MLASLHVLFLGDDSDCAERARAAIEKAGYLCEWEQARTFEEFVDRLSTPDYDLILSSHGLSSFDELSALKFSGQRELDIPLILISDVDDEDTAQESLATGASGFVSKDCLSHIGPVVARALAEKEAERRQRLMEEAMQETEARCTHLFNASLDGILVIESETGRILEVNPAASRILGYEEEFFTGKNVSDLFPPIPSTSIDELLKKARVYGPVFESLDFLRVDGSGCLIDLTANFIRWGKSMRILVTFRDVTEQHEADYGKSFFLKSWQASEERFSKAFNASPLPMSISRLRNWRIFSVNESFLQMSGYLRSEVLGRTAEDLNLWMEPDQHIRVRKILEEEGSIRDVEAEARTKNGERRVVLMSAEVIDINCEPCVLVTTNDITERKQAEESLSQSQKSYETLVNSIDGIVWEADAQTFEFSFVSKQAERLLGYPIERWLKEPGFWKNHIHPDDREKSVAFCLQATAEKKNHEFEYRIITADGRAIWLRDIVTVIVEDDRAVRLRGVMVDITEQKRAQAARAAAEARYRETIENANDIIYTHDLLGNYTSINKIAEQLTGYSRQEVTGLNMMNIVAPEYLSVARDNIFQKIVGQGEATTYEIEIICKDGRRLPLEVNSRLVCEGNQPVAVQGIARDISERKHAEAERQRLEEQLLQAQKMESIGRLASGVAHDFNNLLTAIIGYSQIVLSRLDQNSPLHKANEEILKAGQRAAELTSQLLIFSRRQKLQRRSININDAIGNLIRMLRRIIGEDVEVEVRAKKGLPLTLVDPAQIEQVIMNLAVNARDAMPSGGRLCIETSTVTLDDDYCRDHFWARPGQYVQICVTDTGLGIDSETLKHIFEPFFTTKEAGKGTGLGLAVVYGIVRQHDGLIHVDSEPERGTTFQIYLPVHNEATREEGEEIQTPPCNGSETILVAEDEESLRRLAAYILEGLGYRVLLARDGKEALQIYKSYREEIDLVILDMIMPRMGAIETYERIRKLNQNVPVIFVTGYSTEIIETSIIEEMGKPLIQKPYSIIELSRKVRDALDRQEKVQETTDSATNRGGRNSGIRRNDLRSLTTDPG